MYRMITVGLLALLLLAVSTATGKEFPGVEALMSEEEFAAAGLNKLTAGERKALNEWLLRYTTDDVPELVKEVPELKEAVALQQAVAPKPEPAPEPETDQPIVSNIVGEFKGWTGKTVFKLENGQIWKQRQSGRYLKKLENPEVEISKNLLGFYMMELVETGKRIGVKRLR